MATGFVGLDKPSSERELPCFAQPELLCFLPQI